MKSAKKINRMGGLRGLSFVVFFSVTYFSGFSHAQYLTGPVASGLGGAGRGAVDEGEQIFLNPATIVHASPFTSALFYIDGYTEKNEHDNILGLSLADNTEGLFFSGGYAYAKRRRTYDARSTIEEQYHQVSLGKFALRHLSFGATVTFLDTDMIEGPSYRQWDFHIGSHYNPHPNFGIGLVFYNVASRHEKVPAELQNLDAVALGAHYIFMPMFRLRLDISQQMERNPDQKIHYQMGVESHLSNFMVTRIGYDVDTLAKRNVYSLGVGFNGPRLKLDYFYRKDSDYSAGALHGVDLRLPFW